MMRKTFKVSLVLASLLLLAVTLAYPDSLALAFQEPQRREILGLKITGFVEKSNLKNAGAQEGDIVTHYNGIKIDSLAQLLMLRDQLKQDTVDVVLKRGVEEVKVRIPKGMLGANLSEIVPDHMIERDAVIIKGIGRLGWGMGMENSFLGCVTLLEEKFGSKLNYQDIIGLSGYGFRLSFFRGFCPSSPDATCGYDVGSGILKRLGYEFEVYSLPHKDKASKDEIEKARPGLLRKIKASIDKGWPVIAIDLIDIAEWGLITGYQKNGEELFCRTYFDMTDGYEIARKFPGLFL